MGVSLVATPKPQYATSPGPGLAPDSWSHRAVASTTAAGRAGRAASGAAAGVEAAADGCVANPGGAGCEVGARSPTALDGSGPGATVDGRSTIR